MSKINLKNKIIKGLTSFNLSHDLREHYNTSSTENVSNNSHNNSLLKEKNFYDLNKSHLKEKILKSLDFQAKTRNMYIDKILHKEHSKTKMIDQYIEKSINEKKDKDIIEDVKSKNKKMTVILNYFIQNFKNYFQVIDQQISDKKKKIEYNNSYKKLMKEMIDREVIYIVIISVLRIIYLKMDLRKRND